MANTKSDAVSEMVDTTGLPRHCVLRALVNAMLPCGKGSMDANASRMMTNEQAMAILSVRKAARYPDSRQTFDFDFVFGRPIKVNLQNERCFDPKLYDRDASHCTAAHVIANLRNENYGDKTSSTK